MKRYGNLYEKIISKENLILADERARKGKIGTYGVKCHDKNKSPNIEKLHEELKNKTFKTSEYHIFTIKEPKERQIYRLPYFPDRIVHHAVMNIMEPIWVKCMTADTYSCLKDRGIHGAMRNLENALKDKANTKYCLKVDIRKYYPSVDHEILKRIIRKKIKCDNTLNLLDEIIDSAPGIPIGNYLSQYFANMYLTYFDHWVKEKLMVKYYFRYADDMVFLSPSKADLHFVLSEIKYYLDKELKLELKRNYQIFPVEKRGIDFVGFVFYHTHRRIRKSIKKNFCKAVAKANKSEIDIGKYKLKVSSWLGWAKHSNSKHLLKSILKTDYYESIVSK